MTRSLAWRSNSSLLSRDSSLLLAGKKCALVTTFMSIALLLAGCQANASHQDKVGPVKTQNPLEMKLTPTLRRQIQVGELKWAPVSGRLRVSGRVEADATRLARIGSPVTGRITDLLVM